VLRGGSWNNKSENLRAANRNRNEPDNRNNNIGFRVARVLSPASTLDKPGTTGWPEPVRSRSQRVCQ
jgi:hypothetical protein